MHTTPLTLLERLRCHDDASAWGQFVELYSPLFLEWTRRNRVPESDAPDLVQSVLLILLKQLPRFEHRSGGSFRGWLFTVLLNTWRDHCRASSRQPSIAPGIAPEEQPIADPIIEFTEREYQGYLIRRTLQLVQRDFPSATWKAFWLHVVEGKSASAVATLLNTTPNAIYLARGRILKRVREELAGFLE